MSYKSIARSKVLKFYDVSLMRLNDFTVSLCALGGNKKKCDHCLFSLQFLSVITEVNQNELFILCLNLNLAKPN